MTNKREFKKYVDAVGASVCNEMMAAYYNAEGANRDAIGKAIQKVLGAIGAAKSHANVFFDKGAKAFEDRKAYSVAKREFFRSLFRKITSDFAEEVNAAVRDFNAALPESVKEANKMAVSE